MRKFNGILAGLALAAMVAVLAGPAQAGGVIVSPGGGYSVGISDDGNLAEQSDTAGSLIFRRNADGFDPIIPGTPWEGWGVSAGSVGGTAIFNVGGGNGNIINLSSSYGASTASTSSKLNDVGGSGADLLRVDQSFSFLAENVIKIAVTVTNISGAAQAVLFSRHVDWDTLPVSFSNFSTIPPFGPPILDATFQGFEDVNPLTPYFPDSSFGSPGPGGGTSAFGDLGGAFKLDLGLLADGASTSFSIYHALSDIGETESALRAQVIGLGATFVITGSDELGVNSAAIGTDLPFTVVNPVPEPASLTLLAVGSFGATVLGLRRRKVTV